MKYYICITILILFGCNSNTLKQNKINSNIFTVKDTLSLSALSDTIPITKSNILQKNQRDKQGRKQGLWEIKQKYVKGFETYTNDTLNGAFKRLENYYIFEGQYKKGLKEGLWKWKEYEIDTTLIMVVLYKDGKDIWMGFPLADSDFHSPVKGFNVYVDSIFIRCPYFNNTIWYEGLFMNRKPVGIHKMYYSNGKIKFEHNYATARIKVYDKNGRFVEEKDDDIGKGW
jgi:hypothetical protein